MKKIILPALLLLCTNLVAQQTPTVQEIINSAPLISLKNKNIANFTLKITLNSNRVPLKFQLKGNSSGQIQTELRTSDETPIAIASADRIMFYDSFHSTVSLADGYSFFHLQAEEQKNAKHKNKLTLQFLFYPKSNDKKETIIDIKSLLKRFKENATLTQENEQDFLFIGKMKGAKLKAYITPSRKEGAFKRVELYTDDDKEPMIRIHDIKLNHQSIAKNFSFPDQALSDSKLKAQTISLKNMPESEYLKTKILQSLFTSFYLAMGDIESKAFLEKMTNTLINWQQLAEAHKKKSKLLKKIFN